MNELQLHFNFNFHFNFHFQLTRSRNEFWLQNTSGREHTHTHATNTRPYSFWSRRANISIVCEQASARTNDAIKIMLERKKFRTGNVCCLSVTSSADKQIFIHISWLFLLFFEWIRVSAAQSQSSISSCCLDSRERWLKHIKHQRYVFSHFFFSFFVFVHSLSSAVCFGCDSVKRQRKHCV